MPAKKKAAAAKKPSAPSQFATPDGGPWGAVFLPRAPGERRYWLVKSEPTAFSWADLQAAPKRTTHWDGVRNFAARNFLRDGMQEGDQVFFYHSSAEPPAIVGICDVVRAAYPDLTAFDVTHDGYDETSSREAPTWYMVDLRAVAALATPVTLPMIKATRALAQMALIRTGRLSVIPLTSAEWNLVMALGRA